MSGPVPPEYAHLLRPDGSVVVPGGVAEAMLRLLVLGVTAAARRDAGGRPAVRVLEVLHALNAAAVKEAEMSANGRDYSGSVKLGVSGGSWLSCAEVAALLQCTGRTVRRACEAGRLPARKVGRQWLVSETALDTYRFGKAA